jgi:hypothetical protein
VNLLFLNTKNLRQCPGSVGHALRGIVHDEIVAIPSYCHRMQFDGVVTVARSSVYDVDFMRRCCQRRLSIPYLEQQRFPLKDSLLGVGLRVFEYGHRSLRLVSNAYQRFGVVRPLLRFGKYDGNGLASGRPA